MQFIPQAINLSDNLNLIKLGKFELNKITVTNKDWDHCNFILIYEFQPFQCGDRLYSSEPDVCLRQILAYKDGRRNERITTFIMATYP